MASVSPGQIRLIALGVAAGGAVLLPVAVAQARPSHTGTVQTATGGQTNQNTPALLGGIAPQHITDQLLQSLNGVTAPVSGTAAGTATTPTPTPTPAAPVSSEFCGQESHSAAGTVKAQACVAHDATTRWAKAYVTNTSSTAQIVVLNLTGTDGSVLQIQCTIAAGDANGTCETPRVPLGGASVTHDAVAEVVGEGAPVSAGVLHVESGAAR